MNYLNWADRTQAQVDILFDRIFTRMGTNDNLEVNESSLSLELQQTFNILSNLSNDNQNLKLRTLIITEGIARSTSYDEGLSITYGVLEEFLRNNNTYLIMSCIENQLINLRNIYRLLSVFRMQSYFKGGKIFHTYKCKKIKPEETSEDGLIEFDNFPSDFKKEYHQIALNINFKSDINIRFNDLEEKYNQNLKEMILSYLSIMTVPQEESEKLEKLEQLRRKYMKNM